MDRRSTTVLGERVHAGEIKCTVTLMFDVSVVGVDVFPLVQHRCVNALIK